MSGNSRNYNYMLVYILITSIVLLYILQVSSKRKLRLYRDNYYLITEDSIEELLEKD